MIFKCVVPGSGFQQAPGTHHYRTTFLPPENQLDRFLDAVKVGIFFYFRGWVGVVCLGCFFISGVGILFSHGLGGNE